MFRTEYSALSLAQVKAIVSTAGAPTCGGAPDRSLIGEHLRFVPDREGIMPPEQEYEFPDGDTLILRENGTSFRCAYKALRLKDIVLFAFMIPGTLRGYTVVLDLVSGAAVTEEMWFIDHEGKRIDTREKCLDITELMQLGFFVNREVERQICRGRFLREGKTPGEKSFERGLRLDNKMVFWIDDLGRRQVFTYVSNYFSTLVEPGTPDGENILSLPSDYLQISDSMFFYSVGEVEYSGRLSVEVIDLFTMRKIGMIMGIDENDRFEFSLYRAEGRYLGQYATFYDFDDLGREASQRMTGRFGAPTKGFRGTYRTSVLARALTDEQVRSVSAGEIPVFDLTEKNSMITAGLRMEDSRECVGRRLLFRDDGGYEAGFDFISDTALLFREGDGEWAMQEYRASQLDEHLVYLGFHVAGSIPASSVIAAIDLENGCATVIRSRFGGGHEPHDVVNRYHFGSVTGEGITSVPSGRHGFTRELLGRSFTWSYSRGVTSQHIYNAPNSCSWTIFTGGEPGRGRGGFVWSAPCTYIRLREDVYIMTWVEEKWSGTMSSIAMNLRIMHDTGFYLYIEHDGSRIGFNQISAFGRDAGRCDMTNIYT